jgi:hypothetical protein
MRINCLPGATVGPSIGLRWRVVAPTEAQGTAVSDVRKAVSADGYLFFDEGREPRGSVVFKA